MHRCGPATDLSSSSTTRTAAANAVILGQADAMSADSPVTPTRSSTGKASWRPTGGLRLRAVRLGGGQGFAAGAVAAAGAGAPDWTGAYKQIATNWGAESGMIDKPVINGAVS